MADEIDLANDLIDIEVSRALSKMRQNSLISAKKTKFCVECGDDIPLARQKLGFNLCKPCAEEAERLDSLYAE